MGYKSILYIDDDADDIELFVETMLRISPPVDYVVWSDPVSALHELNNDMVAPDVIFLDLQMGGMSGEDFLLKLKLHPKLAAIPVIIISGHTSEQVKSRCFAAGAERFITKPSNFAGWIEMVRNIVN